MSRGKQSVRKGLWYVGGKYKRGKKKEDKRVEQYLSD